MIEEWTLTQDNYVCDFEEAYLFCVVGSDIFSDQASACGRTSEVHTLQINIIVSINSREQQIAEAAIAVVTFRARSLL